MKTRMKVWLPIVVVLGSLLVAIVIVASKPDVVTQAPDVSHRLVDVAKVELKQVQMKVHSQGTVVPRTESALVAQVSGLVTKVTPAFVAGGFFEQGDVLVTLDKRDYRYAVAQAQAQVARAELALKIEREEGRLAIEEWQRLNDTPAPPLVAREPQLREAEAALQSAQAALGQAELNLERTTIRAPFAGRVRSKAIDLGQFVTAGMQLATIYAIDYVEVRLPLPDDELAFIEMPFDFRDANNKKKGPTVLLRADFAGARQEWTGHIARLEAEVDLRSRMVHAVVRVENPYGQRRAGHKTPLAVGLFVHAEIQGKRYDEILVIPRSAIREDGTVLVLDQGNRIRSREIDLLRLEDGEAFVSSGLAEGELICLSGLDIVVEGMQVNPVY